LANINDVLKRDIRHRKDFERVTDTGDLDTMEGLLNIERALFRRLVTNPGAMIHRGKYGVGIRRYQNAPNTLETQRDMAIRIKENFERDSRVIEVRGVRFEVDDFNPDVVRVITRVNLVGFLEREFVFDPFGEVF